MPVHIIKGVWHFYIPNDLLNDRSHYLENLIAEKNRALQDAPEGHLHVRQKAHSTKVQYYIISKDTSPNGRYLRCNELSTAKALAQKAYDEQIRGLSLEEHDLLQQLADFYSKKSCAEGLFAQLPLARRQLITPIQKTDEELIEEWNHRVYTGKSFPPNFPEYYTGKKERVRSKSEIMIADGLSKNNVLYHYEEPVYLEGYGWIYPDFHIFNLRLRKELYWEHLGLLDVEEYRNSSMKKLHMYLQAGLIYGDNLILSFETSKVPLDTRDVQLLIDHFCK